MKLQDNEMNNCLLKENNIRQYKLRDFGKTGTLVEYERKPFFIIGSGVNINDHFVIQLLESLILRRKHS